MTTLLLQGTKRCTARCHDSTGDPARCHCLCGGRLHGVRARAVSALTGALRRGELPLAYVAPAYAHLCDEPLPGL